MARYLLAAEVDKIQDFIFRSARLREVVGGSQLLNRFCEDVPRYLMEHFGGDPYSDIIISNGGSFRIFFDDKGQALEFGERLAEVYRLATGGTLTVAEPVEIKGDFKHAGEEALDKLRQAKQWRKEWQVHERLPYMAICTSCGIGEATEYQAYHQNEDPQYVCISCLNKSSERAGFDKPGTFLQKFYDEVVGKAAPGEVDWPGKKKRRNRSDRDFLEDIADYDPRRYVAYLLADGNLMGEIFSACHQPEQMKNLSENLERAICRALAVPTKKIMEINQLNDRPGFIPVMPLILGGDDLFALIPAPWAINFAQCFCREYEKEMASMVKELELECTPTVSVAVVICKHNYPYKLAYETGELRMHEAKRLAKQITLDIQQLRSVVNFQVIQGGYPAFKPSDGTVRPGLRPYLASGGEIEEIGLPAQWLIEQRWDLRNVNKKRLAEIKTLFDKLSVQSSLGSDEMKSWHTKLQRLVKRIEQREPEQGQAIRKTLIMQEREKEDKTDDLDGYWYKVYRISSGEQSWYGHALPDLLEAWDFALSLDRPSEEYGGE